MTARTGLQAQGSMPVHPVGAKQSPHRRHHLTAVCPRPRLEAGRQASSRLQHLMLTAVWVGSAQLTVLCGSSLTTPSLAIGRMAVIGSMLGASSYPLWRPGTTPSWGTCTLIRKRHQTTRSRHHFVLQHLRFALIRTTGRPTSKLQRLSWNPGPARGSDRGTLATHLNGPWHVVCIQEGAGFVTDDSLAENFYVITQHHCAVLLNKGTSEREYTCTPIQVPCSLRYSSWAVEGMVVTGKFHRAPDPSCSHFTVANIHINNECAKRRSVCIVLLLLILDLCMKLGAVILTSDVNMDAEGEVLPSGSRDQRRITPLEAAFSHACIPWRYFRRHAIVGPWR